MQRIALTLSLAHALFAVSNGVASAQDFFPGTDGASFRSINLPGIFDGLSDISADGTIAVGNSGGFGSFSSYWANTATGAHTEFTQIPGGVPGVVSPNHDIGSRTVSGDGTSAFGTATNFNDRQLATAYPASGDSFLLDGGDLDGGDDFGEPFGASFDGSVVVGQSTSDNGTEAFRWTDSGGMVGLGDLSGGAFFSRALAISNDGSVIVGDSISTKVFGNITFTGPEAFRWTESGGMVGLGGIAGSLNTSSAFGISGDGTVVVGQTRVPGSGSPGRDDVPGKWTSENGWTDLGPFNAAEADPSGERFGIAEDASLDGSVIVGNALTGVDSSGGATGFVWTAASGMRALQGVLADASIDLTNWSNVTVTAISDDGLTVVGSATSPTDSVVAFVAQLPASFVGSELLFGDADNNLTVSGSDLLAVTNNFGNTGPADGLLLGDADDNGTVSGSDLLAVTNNFGATLGALRAGSSPTAGGTTPVPEPASAILTLAASSALVLMRRSG